MSRKKKKSTHSGNKDIAMAYRIESLPGRVHKRVFLQTLLDFLNGKIDSLPNGWKVTWLWRNSRKSELRSDSFEQVIADSRDSFMSLMTRRLRRDLQGVTGEPETGKRPTRKRRAKKGKGKKTKSSKREKRRMSKMPKRKSRHKAKRKLLR